ncbi:MAG: hypothetical protein PHQ90_04775 [Sulfuricurvum sp.]|uniref:CC0125/CC1285 family lipoprotein n=1 Tax=Sulfuricurvum sp. TaxID=2025608 RepID=UPI002610A0B3|nr:hypothetical protein [Sulfuricurvum sp.]MDD2368595.1 hypothetical protein [Sulfuricurvum sp.]MDD5118130.1 hypothetical protein [Sulfuricurvum sp.]
MSISKMLFIFSTLFILVGCATPYQPFELFGRGGYSEKQNDDGTFQVAFYGNHVTGMETITSLLQYRSAELTVSNGYDYYEVINSNGHIPLNQFGGFRSSQQVIKMYKGSPQTSSPNIFVAKKVLQDFGPYVSQQK